MQTLPLAAVPSQNFSVTLAGQAVQIALYLLGAAEASALYMDLVVNGAPVFTSRIVRSFPPLPENQPPFMTLGEQYHGFLGDLLFVDTQATPTNPVEDPRPEGLGTRWQLLYFTVADLQAAGLVSS